MPALRQPRQAELRRSVRTISGSTDGGNLSKVRLARFQFAALFQRHPRTLAFYVASSYLSYQPSDEVVSSGYTDVMTPRLSGRRRSEASTRRRSRQTRPIVSADQLLALVSAKDLDALIVAAFHVLQEAVTSDFASAFYRSSSKGTLKERDSRGRQYGPAFMRRYMELNPAIPLTRATPGLKVLPTRIGLPRDWDLQKTPFYREIMQRQGWRHAVALCFWGDPPADLPIFVTSVYRMEGRRDFSDADIARLTSIHPFIDSAVSRLLERDASKSVWDGLVLTVRDGAFGLAVLDCNLGLVEANPLARRLFAAWVGGVSPRRRGHSVRAWRLPPELEQACVELRDEWQSQLQTDPDSAILRRRSGISHPHLRGVTTSITMVCRNATGLSEPTFVLELKRIESPDSASILLQTLTSAERAVAMALMDGHSNQEIADDLGKSVQAVKFLLHRIYRKTGVANRAALVAALRTVNAPP